LSQVNYIPMKFLVLFGFISLGDALYLPGNLTWLEQQTRILIQNCQLQGINDTAIFTPDGTQAYGAQWTRDFYYMLKGFPDAFNASTAHRAIRYTYSGQRYDGCMPDRVQSDGTAVYNPGPAGSPSWPNHAWDNSIFAPLLLVASDQLEANATFFCSLEPLARRALDFVNRSRSGLVYNDIDYPNSTYGFTDTVAKTGFLLFSSLLYYDATVNLARISAAYGCGDASQYGKQADQVARAIDVLYDPSSELFLAASHDNSLPDIWGSAYVVALNLSSSARRQGVAAAILSQGIPSSGIDGGYLGNGQLRHLPQPLAWTRCCWTPGCTGGCPTFGTYQNGGYWATPLSYLAQALINQGRQQDAIAVVRAAMADFAAQGIQEDVTPSTQAHGVAQYVASATNVVLAARILGL
jgi:hypothetical protein